MPPNEEHATWILDDSPNKSALSILRIVKAEAADLGVAVTVEENEEKKISNRVRISLKMNGKVFRLTLAWVRDECLDQAGVLGNGYIQTDLHLRLRCKEVRHPSDKYGQPPFLWHVERDLTDEERRAGPPFPPERILDETLLGSVIREKLAAPPLT
jgi:hypothetical protein